MKPSASSFSKDRLVAELSDEIERIRQQMTDEARANEVALVRLAADLEKLEMGLIEQLRSIIQAHEERRNLFLDDLKTLSDGVRSGRTQQRANLNNNELPWVSRQGHLEYDTAISEEFPN
jgi:hypothetical protein